MERPFIVFDEVLVNCERNLDPQVVIIYLHMMGVNSAVRHLFYDTDYKI